MIVNRADTFGLAQLYQLRGRVGRSHHRAYAYLLIPGEHLITPDAQKRLRVLQELDDLGGGFRLAAHDLEIRGAGNLLGKQQSGHITAVGLELYTHMLEQAVRELRGEPVGSRGRARDPARHPGLHPRDLRRRREPAPRASTSAWPGIRGMPDLEAIADELVDRYGPVPPLVDTLLRAHGAAPLAEGPARQRARRRGDAVVLEFDPSTPVTPERAGRGRASSERDGSA